MSRRVLMIGLAVAALALLGAIAQPARAAGWDYDLGMYLWALGMDGTTTVKGQEVETDVSFSEIWDNLDMAFSTHLEANQRDGNWAWFFDLYWASLGNDIEQPKGEWEMSMTYLEGAVGYNATDDFQLFGGIRYISMDFDVDLDPQILLPPVIPTEIDAGQSWADLMLGARLKKDLGERWKFWGRADLAGFGVTDGTDLTWNLVLMGNVKIAKKWGLAFGYRWLDIDYENKDDNFAMDLRQEGPILAVNYSFH